MRHEARRRIDMRCGSPSVIKRGVRDGAGMISADVRAPVQKMDHRETTETAEKCGPTSDPHRGRNAQSSSGQALNCDGSRTTLYGRRFVFIRSASATLFGLCALDPQYWSSPSRLTSTNASLLTSPQPENRKVSLNFPQNRGGMR
jgi:hypothetical protein